MMHEGARAQILAHLRTATTSQARDTWLDYFIDRELRATEWDAGQWGFDPDKWMAEERKSLAARGGVAWPREVI